MPTPHPDKAQLRKRLRELRRALSEREQLEAGKALPHRVSDLPQLAQVARCAFYLAADGEIETSFLADHCRRAGHTLYLPVIQADNSLEFALWEPGTTLATNRYGIGEPPCTAPRLLTRDLDIVFLPLVGWDRQGRRLGMGGGFYDRSLAGVSGPVLVGLAHDCQEVAEIPGDEWDVKLDYVATPGRLLRCEAGK